ncbi:MAG: YibE/F family protein [Candidatus Paceibacterota bacterium]
MNFQQIRFVFVGCLLAGVISLSFAGVVQAQSEQEEDLEIVSATVTRIFETREQELPGLDRTVTLQTVEFRVTEGEAEGRLVELEQDLAVLEPGQKVFLSVLETDEGVQYSLYELDRRTPLLILGLVFAATVVAIGGWQGMRSLVSLAISFFAILYVLLPLLTHGYSPVLVSIAIGVAILTLAIYITHGVSRQSSVALFGTLIAITFSGLLAHGAVEWITLTGFASEASSYLSVTSDSITNFRGLLLGGIIIGMLGALDDIAIIQVSMVNEFKRAKTDLSSFEIFMRAMRVGREHAASLVNTLVLAYVGVALPLLLLIVGANVSFGVLVSSELFATEIVRTLVGSIGLILTVPITTLFATIWLTGDEETAHDHHH